jgi:hypothetical protein
MFHDIQDRFGGSSCNADLELYCLTAWRHERGRFLPTALMATEPLTPLSRFPEISHPRASPAFAGAATWPYVRLLNGLVRVGGCGKPPRPPLTPAREDLRLVMIRNVFYR